MKSKIIFCICLLLSSVLILAQDTLYIYKSGLVTTKVAIVDIDSIVFNKAKDKNSSEILFNPDLTYGNLSDVDGNNYKTIIIGTQTWMAENLKTTRYNDGTSIMKFTDLKDVVNDTIGAFGWYNDDSITYSKVYGAYYNWFATSKHFNGSKNVCPINWHVPSNSEWSILVDYIGGENYGYKLKEIGTSKWIAPNSGTNITGFSAVPAGAYSWDNMGEQEYWWTSTGMQFRFITYDVYITNLWTENYHGFSIRCLKD
jgi:uncharacterized protein (TIGR02145 family)